MTSNSSDFAVNRVVFGTTGGYDAFVMRLLNALEASDTSLNVSEVGVHSGYDVGISEGALVLRLFSSSYVGFDVYDPSGRLVKRVSLGYLPAGRYEYRLNLPKGTYLLKVRIGDEVRTFRGVI